MCERAVKQSKPSAVSKRAVGVSNLLAHSEWQGHVSRYALPSGSTWYSSELHRLVFYKAGHSSDESPERSIGGACHKLFTYFVQHTAYVSAHLVAVDNLGCVEVSEGPHEERVFGKAWFCTLELSRHHKHRFHSSHPPIVVILKTGQSADFYSHDNTIVHILKLG